MAGHSHWAGIKHKKALIDSKRGKLWSKLSKAIIIAAKMGGGDPDANIRLRKAIDDAKAVSMPKDNIERAIKRGTGELDGGNVEEILYEGYGPGGVAVMCEIMTDNRNRTAPELRNLFSKNGGNLGATGCVGYLFERKGLFIFPSGTDEEQVTMVALEHGGEDVEVLDDGRCQVVSSPDAFAELADAFTTAELNPETSEVTRLPQNMAEVDGATARACLRLLEALDDHDDVQNVFTNLDIPADVMAEMNE